MDDSATELTSGFGQPVAPEQPSVSPAIPGPSGPPPSSAMMGHYGSMQDAAAAKYQKVKEVVGNLAALRKQMDSLGALGDMVSQDDIVKSAAELVASGFGAVQVAGILADMPPDGPALQGWIQDKDKQVRQREAQAEQALAVSRHEMGLTALRHIIGASVEGQQTQGAPPQPASSPNPLALNGASPSEAPNAG